MASEQGRNALGFGLLGLGLGIILFSVFYIVVFRAGVAQRFVWSWVFIHLLVLLGPAVLLALYGWTRKPSPMV